MNNLEEKLDKFLTPDFAPEDSLNASILRKAMEMEVNKSFKISILFFLRVLFFIYSSICSSVDVSSMY